MTANLEFYFDFSSPYAYLASCRIDEVAAAHGRGVDWRPFLLGVVFGIAGTQPLTQYPLKGDYSRMDFERCARRFGLPFAMPADFPKSSVHAARAYYWLEENGADQARGFAKAIFAAYFVDGRDISQAETVLAVAGELDLDRDAVAAGIQEPAIKAKLRDVTDDAIQNRNVFGAPFVFVDGEPFWGNDRLADVDAWLRTGGW